MEQMADKPKIPWAAKYLSIALMSWCAWYIARTAFLIVMIALPSTRLNYLGDGAGYEGFAAGAILAFCFLAVYFCLQTFTGEMSGWYGTLTYALIIVLGMALWLRSDALDLINWIIGPVLIVLSIAAIWQYRDYRKFSEACYQKQQSSQTKHE